MNRFGGQMDGTKALFRRDGYKITLTREGLNTARDLTRKGYTGPKIAHSLGLGKAVVYRELARHGIARRRQPLTLPSNNYIRRTSGHRVELTQEGKKLLKRMIESGSTYLQTAFALGISDTRTAEFAESEGLKTKMTVRRQSKLAVITEAHRREILRLFLLGTPFEVIADKVLLRKSLVRDTLEQFGLPRLHARHALRNLTDEDRAEIAKDHNGFLKRTIAIVDFAWSHGCSPTRKQLAAYGIPRSQYLFVMLAWRLKNKKSFSDVKRGPPPINTVARLLVFADSVLATLPDTPATNPKLEPDDIFYRRLLQYVALIEDSRLRNTFTLLTLLLPSPSEAFRSFQLLTMAMYRYLKSIARNIGVNSLYSPATFETYISELVKGQHPGVLTRYGELSFLGAYRTLANKQIDYLANHDPKWRKLLSRYLLLDTRTMPKLARLSSVKELVEDQRARRKYITSIVHNQYYQIRFVAQLRLNSVRRLYQAVLGATGQYDYSRNQPLRFSYEEDAVDVRGRTAHQTVSCELWDYRLVASAVKEQTPHKWKTYGLAVRFVGCSAKNSTGDTVTPWWQEFFAAHVYTRGHYRKSLSEFNTKWGYPDLMTWHFPISFGGRGRSRPQLSKLNKQGYCFFDLERLYFATLAGATIVQLGTKCGLRIGEMLQIAASRKCLLELQGLPGRTDPVYGVQVVPKGRDKREIKYIDADIWELLVELAKFHVGTNGTKHIPVVAADTARRPFPADRYFLQFRRSICKQGMLNECLRFIVHGLVVDPQTNRHVVTTVHAFRHAYAAELQEQGVPIEIIAKLLSHRRLEPTEYYAEPPLHRVREAAERLFIDRIVLSSKRIRSPEEVERLIREAQSQVGALTEVVGGTCIVGSMCPAKFVCIGCAGNVPNPKKRPQIEEKKRWAAKQVEWADKENLPAESRQAKQIIDDCDLMLEEMRLVEISHRDAQSGASQVRCHSQEGQSDAHRSK